MPTISAHISPADKAADDYCYVPFDVPARIARIDVRYEYSHPRHHGDFEGEGNTIDLGLFDPRGHAFGNAAGFRGWSGSDRAQISLGESAADTTPGYLDGPIPAGRWHVILGLYRVAPEGCDYTLTVEFTPHADEAMLEPAQAAGRRADEVATTAAARRADEVAASAAAGRRADEVAAGTADATGRKAENGGARHVAERIAGSAAGPRTEELAAGAAGPKAEEIADGAGRAPLAMPVGAARRTTEEAAPATGAETAARPARGARWYRGDLQSHSEHSDAKGSLATLAATARTRGLDFLAVTDHNTISHIRAFDEVSNGVLLIPSMEVTTYYGHMNAWGIREWVDFRARDLSALRQIVAAVHAQGGLASVNHPKTGGPPWEYGDALDFDCIEVWQAPWPFYNTESFAWWESLLRQGRRVVAVGGSDYHQPEEPMRGNPHLPGQPTTWVYADELSVGGILNGIRRGHVFISADVGGPMLYFSGSAGGQTYRGGDHVEVGRAFEALTVRVQHGAGMFARLIAGGEVVAELPVDADDWTQTWNAPKAAGYYRAEVVIRPSPAEWVMAALSNPIYV